MPAVRFKGTYREEGWRRCALMSAADGIVYTPWPHDGLPNWSLPALEAGKCVALQSEAAFATVHLKLYEAFFTHSRNIADRKEVEAIVAESDVDVERFKADYAAGAGREAVIKDYEVAIREHGVQSIPTVIFPDTGRALVGLAEPSEYRARADEALSVAR